MWQNAERKSEWMLQRCSGGVACNKGHGVARVEAAREVGRPDGGWRGFPLWRLKNATVQPEGAAVWRESAWSGGMLQDNGGGPSSQVML